MFKAILAAGLLTATTAIAQISHHIGVVHTAAVDLGYETFGAASPTQLPVLVINGGPGLSHSYVLQNDVWPGLAKRRLIVFYDQRGTGASKQMRPDAKQTGEAQLEDIEAILDALHLQRVIVVGDSYGGLLAMMYAASHPDHVAGLILSDSPPSSLKEFVTLLPQVYPDKEEENNAAMQQASSNPEAAAQLALVNHFRMCFYSEEKRDMFFQHIGNFGFEPIVAATLMKAGGGFDLSAQVARFSFPVLVINGRFDMNVAPINAWKLTHAIPGSKLVWFEHSGHFPYYEEPEQYTRVIESFANSLSHP